jgi:hypothetical protein
MKLRVSAFMGKGRRVILGYHPSAVAHKLNVVKLDNPDKLIYLLLTLRVFEDRW